MTFGERLVFYRKQAGMLQKELAEKTGLSPTALNYYEKDKREPSVLIIKKLAKALKVTGDDLLGMNESDKKHHEKEYKLSAEEFEIIEKYRLLNESDKSTVDFIFSKPEYNSNRPTPDNDMEIAEELTSPDTKIELVKSKSYD